MWLRPPHAPAEAAARLLLLPHAGGGIARYSRWPSLVPEEIFCQRVQLPGHQDRRREEPFTALPPLLDALREVLDAERDGLPTILFGHSMGALIAYRLGLLVEPALVAVAGWAPVGFNAANVPAAAMPPPATDQELHELTMPVLRADLAVCASYRDDGAVLKCPLVAYAGSADPLIPVRAIASWAERTPLFLGAREFSGGHFFVHEHAAAIAADLTMAIHQHALR